MTPSLGKNPFRPGVGTRPLYLAGRDGPLRRFGAMLRAAPEQPANMRLTGLRGVGKTVLLAEFEKRAVEANWSAASLEIQPGHNTQRSLYDVLDRVARRKREELSRVERLRAAAGNAIQSVQRLRVTWEGITLGLDPSTPGEAGDLARVLFDLVEVAVGMGQEGVVLLLDEMQTVRDERDRSGEHPLSMLISAVVALQRAEVPVGLVVCGLPTLTGNLLKARSYTERMFRGENIGALEPEEAAAALTEPLRDTAASAGQPLIDTIVDEVEGYPYFIQLWGAEVWDAAVQTGTDALSLRLLETVRSDIYRRLDSDFYEPRVATLTPAEQDLLLATAACPSYPPLIVSEINETSDKQPGNINVLLGRLVEAGVVYRVRKGQYEYTAPKFHQYLLRRSSH